MGEKANCGITQGTHYYASQVFTALTTTVDMGITAASFIDSSGNPAGNDTFIALYSPSFNPSNPNANLIDCNDDAGLPYLSKLSPNLTVGTQYEIIITAYNLNITGTATFSFTPDVTFPDTTTPTGTAISSQTPSGSPTTSTTIQFVFGGATDNVAVTSYECKLDSGTYATCSSPKSYNSLINGSHTFYVRAKDAAGNVDASSASYTWTVTTSSTPPINAPIDLHFSKQVESYSTEIELK